MDKYTEQLMELLKTDYPDTYVELRAQLEEDDRKFNIEMWKKHDRHCRWLDRASWISLVFILGMVFTAHVVNAKVEVKVILTLIGAVYVIGGWFWLTSMKESSRRSITEMVGKRGL